jgi:hypothetical protein
LRSGREKCLSPEISAAVRVGTERKVRQTPEEDFCEPFLQAVRRLLEYRALLARC